MRVTTIHSTVALWVAMSWWSFPFAQTTLPRGAVALINQDHHGSRVALCADTGEAPVQQGAKKSAALPCGLARVQVSGAFGPDWVRVILHGRQTGSVLPLLLLTVCGYFPLIRLKEHSASNRGCRSVLSSSTFAHFRALAGRLTGCCSDWLSPTVVRRGWKCSRPAAAGFSTPLLRSTPPSPGRPHET